MSEWRTVAGQNAKKGGFMDKKEIDALKKKLEALSEKLKQLSKEIEAFIKKVK